MTRKMAVLLAVFGSGAMLSGAFAFQIVGGMHPCTLCLWQRWPHAAAIVIGLLALVIPGRALPLLGCRCRRGTASLRSGLWRCG